MVRHLITGRGAANLQNCSSFLIVELMRAGGKMAVRDKEGARLVELPELYPEKTKKE